MCEMEGEMKTRVRKGSQDTDALLATWSGRNSFILLPGRVDGLCDPQLHVYVFVFNMTWDEEEECWKAGVFLDIKRDAPFFQAAFRVRLANKLQDLGFGVERNRDDFEIAGIPSDCLSGFRGGSVIEKWLGNGVSPTPSWKAELGPKTRKGRGLRAVGNPAERMEEELDWSGTPSVGVGLPPRDALLRQVNGEASAVDHAIEHCFVREAVVPERKLVTEALKRGIGAVTVEDVTREVANRPLIRSDVAGRKMATLKRLSEG